MQEETDNQNYPDIPGYKILSELGRGGIATVYLALQESLDRQVALKVMSPLLAMEPDYAERFIREGRTVAQLNHPNIITVYDIGLQKHQLFIAMEYIPGGNMRTLMQEHIDDPEWALSVAGQIALALGYAHTIGIVHRDVKPENILFRENGAAVLTDFGIAKTITSNTNLTRAGTIIGTPKYMSPEQTDGLGNDPRTDVYSLGIIFYEMLTGHVPYDSENSMAVLYAHVHSPIPELPEELRDLQPLLNSLLAKKGEDRADDCDELAEIIRITRRERHYALKNPEKMLEANLTRELSKPAKPNISTAPIKKKPVNKAADSRVSNYIESLRKRIFTTDGNKDQDNNRLKLIALGLLGGIVVLALVSFWTDEPDSAIDDSADQSLTENNTANIGRKISTTQDNGSADKLAEQTAQLTSPDISTALESPLPAEDSSTAEVNENESPTPASEQAASAETDNSLDDGDVAGEMTVTEAVDVNNDQRDQTDILISRFLADESNDELVKQQQEANSENEEEKPPAISNRQRKINSFLTSARNAIKDERVISPPGDNAAFYYNQVLELSPYNKRARRGLNVSGDLIYEKASEKYKAGKPDLALWQIDAALIVIPEHEKLTSLKQSIEASFNPNSAYAKAEKLYRGVDGPRDTRRAAFYYRKAAELGHVQAMNAIGVAYADGDGVVHSDRLAMKWFEKAAKNDDSEAMYNLALGYHFSDVSDPEKAWDWAKKSADEKYRPAYMLVGWMKTTGTGTNANRFGSIAWDLKGMVNPISSELHSQYRIPTGWQEDFMVQYRAATNTGPQ